MRARCGSEHWAAVLLVGFLAGGCASAGPGAEGTAGDAVIQTVTVTVDNNNWQDATIYVVAGGPRVRLGTVQSMTSRRFAVPPASRRHDGLQLEVDLVGSTVTRMTAPILVKAGEEVRWTLENRLALSSYSVR